MTKVCHSLSEIERLRVESAVWRATSEEAAKLLKTATKRDAKLRAMIGQILSNRISEDGGLCDCEFCSQCLAREALAILWPAETEAT